MHVDYINVLLLLKDLNYWSKCTKGLVLVEDLKVSSSILQAISEERSHNASMVLQLVQS